MEGFLGYALWHRGIRENTANKGQVNRNLKAQRREIIQLFEGTIFIASRTRHSKALNALEYLKISRECI